MELSAFQQRVADFVKVNELEASAQVRMLDLVSEVGEMAKEALNSTQYGRVPFHPTREWTAELGDVLFSLICIANSTGVSLDEALNEALDKYGRRIAKRGEPGSSR